MHNRDGLCCGVGKQAWHTRDHWTSGLWICGIGIDNLTCEDATAPYAMILVNYPSNQIDLQAAREELERTAEGCLPSEDFHRLESDVSSHSTYIWWRPHQLRRDELLSFRERGIDWFIEHIADYFEQPMAVFIPILDQILA